MDYSHSKLDVARTCMKKFKFKYIDKIKIKTDRAAADFGEVCHYISENYTGSGKVELLKLFHDQVPSKITLNEYYKKKIPLALKNIHAFWTTNNPIFKENAELVKKEDEVKTKISDDIELNGKIDLYIKFKNGKLKIIDYKTSKSKEFGDHTNQLSMYMLLLHKKYNIPYDDMDCEIIYLALDPKTKKGEEVLNEGLENIVKTYKLNETDVDCLQAEIDAIHKRIKKSIDTGIWKPKPAWFSCTYCDYKDICEDKFKG